MLKYNLLCQLPKQRQDKYHISNFSKTSQTICDKSVYLKKDIFLPKKASFRPLNEKKRANLCQFLFLPNLKKANAVIFFINNAFAKVFLPLFLHFLVELTVR